MADVEFLDDADNPSATRPVDPERVEVKDEELSRIDDQLAKLTSNEVDITRDLAEARRSLHNSQLDSQKAVSEGAKESFREQIREQDAYVRALEAALGSIPQERVELQKERDRREMQVRDLVAYCDNCARNNAWPWSALKKEGRCMVCLNGGESLNVRPRADLPVPIRVAGEPGTENADGSVPFGTPEGVAAR